MSLLLLLLLLPRDMRQDFRLRQVLGDDLSKDRDGLGLSAVMERGDSPAPSSTGVEEEEEEVAVEERKDARNDECRGESSG